MAKRRLASLGLDENLMVKCSKNNLKTVKDVLDLHYLDLMKKLQLSCDESRAFHLQLYQLVAPKKETAWSLLMEQRVLSLGSATMDKLLGGGLHHSTLIELAGPSGVGKTQWCMEITARCLLSRPDKITPVIYIDTEAAFTPIRLVEVLKSRLADEQRPRIKELLACVFVHQPNTVSGLDKIMQQLEVEASTYEVGVIIVDSIASLARKEFPPYTPGVRGGVWRRVFLMAGWAARLKEIATSNNLLVLVTNQVTSKRLATNHISVEDPEDEEATATVQTTECVLPALGNTWTHFVNTRLVLEYTDIPICRQVLVTKSPVAPFAVFKYSIESKGIIVQGAFV